MAAKIAVAYAGRGVDIDDLVGEANLALAEAVAHFDPSHGVRVSTYAGRRIHGRLLNMVMRQPAPATALPELPTAAPPDGPPVERLTAVLARLSDRERDVLVARYGIGRAKEMLAVIGRRLGLCAERVRRIEAEALARARRMLSKLV